MSTSSIDTSIKKRTVSERQNRSDREVSSSDQDMNNAPLSPPSKKSQTAIPSATSLHRLNATHNPVRVSVSTVCTVGSRTASYIQHVIVNASTPINRPQELTDSVTELKTTVGALGKTIEAHKIAVIPALTTQIEEVEELVAQLVEDMKTVQDQNKTLLEQDLPNLNDSLLPLKRSLSGKPADWASGIGWGGRW